MKKRDQNYIVKVEKAIEKKYGRETIQHPKAHWNEEKEKDYIEQSKELLLRDYNRKQKEEKIEVDGVLISKKLLNRDSNRHCTVCDSYSFNGKDDVYMSKFGCCFQCYVKWIEGREERWNSGWRPEKEQIDG